MTGSPFYHTGILVHDLSAGIERFGDLLRIDFNSPETLDLSPSHFNDVDAPEPILHFAYSKQGPPYVELIQAQKAGIWGRDQGEGLHHIGVREDQLEDRLSELAELASGSVRPQAWLRIDGLLRAVMLTERLHGVRLELVKSPWRLDQLELQRRSI